MCTDTDRNLKSLATLAQRVQDFLDDGYWVFINYKDNSLALVRLRHQNGNIITLKLNRQNGKFCQYTNGILVHEQTLY